MDKYYLSIIQNKTVCAIYAYDSLDEALAQFHSELAYRTEGRDSTLCVIFNTIGTIIKKDVWERQVTE